MEKAPFRTDKWFVSNYCFEPDVRSEFELPRGVVFHDVTLRDGEQQANVVLRKDEKIKIAQALDQAGVGRIEAGLPSVSPQDLEAVKTIAHEKLSAKVFCFSRCMKADVDLALTCDVDGVVMEIPASDHLIKHAYGWSEEKAIRLAVEATSYAHEHGLYVAFFTIDSTRASFETCWRLISSVAEEGHMDSLVLVDTFGVCSPHAMRYFVKKMKEKVDKPLEIHCHNDFGLAVANTLTAVTCGVGVVHVTVNGMGERMGNASLEETAMALKALYGVETGIKYENLYKLSQLVEELSLVQKPKNKPVVGDWMFTIESGIVAGWWSRVEQLNMPLEIFPYLPDLVGANPVRVVLGKKSGRDSVLYKARQLGLDIPIEKLDEILMSVKAYSEKKKRALEDSEFCEIVERSIATR